MDTLQTWVSSKNSETAIDLACELVYRLLAIVLTDPRHSDWNLLIQSSSRRLVCEAADILRSEFVERPGVLGFGELPVDELDVKPLLQELCAPSLVLSTEYVRVFGLSACRECQPYETEYHREAEPFFRSQQMADVAGFYRAFGLEPASISRERPDHIALELDFMAHLLARKSAACQQELPGGEASEYAEVSQTARLHFFQDHVAWWMPSFALALRQKAEYGVYAEAARVLGALLPIERSRLGVAAPSMPLEPRSETQEDLEPTCAGCSIAKE